MAAGTVQAATQTYQYKHVFSVANIVGDFNGTTVGIQGNGTDKSILCGAKAIYPLSPDCPTGEIAPGTLHPQPFTDTKLEDMNGDPISATLYPIDSTFGFNVVPFAAAFDKERGDGIWGEGWAGNVVGSDGKVIGLALSDAETDTFSVPNGLGTWCVGIGGGSVKCSSERFVVMEHLLTCHETIPYYNANPVTGEQAKLEDPDGNLLTDCATKKLDNNLLVLNDSNPSANDRMTGTAAYTKDGTVIPAIDWSVDPLLEPGNILTFLEANESTILDDIAYGNDYSITAKDDGKPLYRWGNLIKRPNDIRVYARMVTPRPWRLGGENANGGKGYRVTKANLIINHLITNNPNDQIRPEDMENEGAIGRLPGYTVSGNKWLSDRDCYQGNGLFLPAGTVLRNGDFAIPTTTKPVAYTGDPYSWSEDLLEGFTNGWATTVDREPFEWAYDTNNDGVADGSVRSPDLIPVGATPLSGPRWRLTPNKFGQDVPGLEIPNVECAPPPYQKDLIKYEVGVPTTTVLNLLDWDPLDERSVDGESPLVWSNGWVVKTFNEGTVVNRDVTVVNPLLAGVTVNGAPVSRDFDLSIYVKGDRKPTAIYNATLQVEWDDNPNYVAP
jgi:hypothetical protein